MNNVEMTAKYLFNLDEESRQKVIKDYLEIEGKKLFDSQFIWEAVPPHEDNDYEPIVPTPSFPLEPFVDKDFHPIIVGSPTFPISFGYIRNPNVALICLEKDIDDEKTSKDIMLHLLKGRRTGKINCDILRILPKLGILQKDRVSIKLKNLQMRQRQKSQNRNKNRKKLR